MTADVADRELDQRLIRLECELDVKGMGGSPSRSLRRPASELSALTLRRRCLSKPVRPMRAWSSTYASATCVTSPSTTRRR